MCSQSYFELRGHCVPVIELCTILLIQECRGSSSVSASDLVLCSYISCKAANDGSSSWVPACHSGDPCEALAASFNRALPSLSLLSHLSVCVCCCLCLIFLFALVFKHIIQVQLSNKRVIQNQQVYKHTEATCLQLPTSSNQNNRNLNQMYLFI